MQLFRPTTLLTPALPPFTHFYHSPCTLPRIPRTALGVSKFPGPLICHAHLSLSSPSHQRGFWGDKTPARVIGGRECAVNSACHLHASRNILKGKPFSAWLLCYTIYIHTYTAWSILCLRKKKKIYIRGNKKLLPDKKKILHQKHSLGIDCTNIWLF